MLALKRIFLASLILLATALTLVLGALYWAYKNPEKVLNVVKERFLPEDMSVSWKDVTFEIDYQGSFAFRMNLALSAVEIQKSKKWFVPIDQVSSELYLRPFQNEKLILNSLVLIAKSPARIDLDPDRKEPAKPKPERDLVKIVASNLNRADRLIAMLNLQTAYVQVQEVRLFKSGNLKYHLDINALKTRRSSLRFKIGIQQPKGPLKLNSTGHLITNSWIGRPTFLRADTEVVWSEIQARFHMEVARKQNHLELHLQTEGVEFGRRFYVKDLQADLSFPLRENTAGGFAVKAPVEIRLFRSALEKKLEKSCKCEFPDEVFVAAEGRYWPSEIGRTSDKKVKVLESQMRLNTLRNAIAEVNLGGRLKAYRKSGEWRFEPFAESTATVNNFKLLSTMFDTLGVLVPAPLDIMNGKVHFRAEGPVLIENQRMHFPLSASTKLLSRNQRVELDLQGRVEMDQKLRGADIYLAVLIQDLQLQLPPVTPLGGKLRVRADRRILKRPRIAKKDGFKVKLFLSFETVRPAAIRLMHEIFDPYLPVTLQVRKHSTETDGYVKAEPFNITYLRRTVQVQKLLLNLDTIGKGVIPIDAVFRVDQSMYTVFIDVEGTVKNPNITMYSEPSLPEEEIVSVLLYDRTSEDLLSADAESAGNAQAAIADRAIGLFGIWLFASTPIQSFSYNPVSGVYSATVTLDEGLTATVGTNWESATQLALHKRLSKRWIISAAWVPPGDDEVTSTRLVLQWEKTF